MTTHAFRAAIFDLDGVIANTAQYQYLSWKSIADDEGFAVPETLGDQVRGVVRANSLDIVLSYAHRPYSPAEKEALAERKNQRYLEMINSLSARNILPGVLDLIAALKAGGVHIALASSSKNAHLVLTSLGIIDRFDYIADANYIKHPKPHPEIFLTAARGVGVAPEECLGLEDSTAGISAIKSAGMFAVGVGSQSRLTQADVVVSSLAKLNPEDFFALAQRV